MAISVKIARFKPLALYNALDKANEPNMAISGKIAGFMAFALYNALYKAN